MSKTSHALVLEDKILSAIESGEFTPVPGYFSTRLFTGLKYIGTGPCGCALAAAASVNGYATPGFSNRHDLIVHLIENADTGMDYDDCLFLEAGYEGLGVSATGRPGNSRNPYYRLGRRLRRFHPMLDGFVE